MESSCGGGGDGVGDGGGGGGAFVAVWSEGVCEEPRIQGGNAVRVDKHELQVRGGEWEGSQGGQHEFGFLVFQCTRRAKSSSLCGCNLFEGWGFLDALHAWL